MNQQAEDTKKTVSEEDILKLARLSSLKLSAEEVELYKKQVADILEMISQLDQINTEGIPPTYQVSGNLNVMRPDEVKPSGVAYGDLLSLAPNSQSGQIKVPKVL